MGPDDSRHAAVLGQKYAFATASLVLGLASFVSLLGLEKALLAVAFGYLALRKDPAPVLVEHRGWAKVGVALGVGMAVLVATFVVLFQERIAQLMEALRQLP